MNLKRALSPALNPAGLMAAAGAIYAAAIMIWNTVHNHGVLSAPVIVAAVTAVAALLTRQVVTPTADPRDGNGVSLKTANAHTAENLREALARQSPTVTVLPPEPPIP